MAVKATFAGLEPYNLSELKVTDRELGHGSYATVLELEYMGLKCAGKRIHELLLQLQGEDSYAVRRFEEECRLLSQVRHPNIVQFLGVRFQQEVQVPTLVMEFLPTNLTSCIEQYGILPKDISYSILYDVALGLCYLHGQTPAIIHRDLSSNNVLLTPNMTAKISDLGVARILNLTPLQRSQQTQTPGTPTYMPPEVMVADPKYCKSLDEFSYGILMIHMFSARWPEPQVGPNRTEPDGRMIPVSEAERREVFLRAIGNDHPLMDLILKCIHNYPQARAHTNEIVERLAEMVLQFPASFAHRLDMLRRIETQEEEKRALTEEREEMARKVEEKDVELSNLRGEMEVKELHCTSEVKQMDLQVKRLKADESLHKSTYSQLETELADVKSFQNAAIRRKDVQIDAKTRALKKMDEVNVELNDQLTRMKEYVAKKQQTPKAGITWKQCESLPDKISGGQSIVIGGKVYCGGQASTSIYCYDPSHDKWTTLPQLPVTAIVRRFGLGHVNGKLVVVGGEKESCDRMHISNEVHTYDRRWRQTIPPMPTARYDPGVLSLQSALVVAGGEIGQVTYTNNVEILKPDCMQWWRTNPLLLDCCRISLVAIDNTCYALGGFRHPLQHLNQALYASVDDLLCNAVPANQTSSSDTQSAWRMLPNTLRYNPAAAVLAGNLLAMGGWEESRGRERRKEVYVYSMSTDSWIYISNLPAPQACSIVATLPSGELLVIGGYSDHGDVKTVYRGILTMDV